jgi:hypothetical protein
MASFVISGDQLEDWEMEATLHGVCADGGCDGVYHWSGTHFIGGMVEERHQRATIEAEGDSRQGELCIDESRVPEPTCAEEDVGWTILQGDRVVVALWDGDIACDGCARLFIEGEEVGGWCP